MPSCPPRLVLVLNLPGDLPTHRRAPLMRPATRGSSGTHDHRVPRKSHAPPRRNMFLFTVPVGARIARIRPTDRSSADPALPPSNEKHRTISGYVDATAPAGPSGARSSPFSPTGESPQNPTNATAPQPSASRLGAYAIASISPARARNIPVQPAWKCSGALNECLRNRRAGFDSAAAAVSTDPNSARSSPSALTNAVEPGQSARFAVPVPSYRPIALGALAPVSARRKLPSLGRRPGRTPCRCGGPRW